MESNKQTKTNATTNKKANTKPKKKMTKGRRIRRKIGFGLKIFTLLALLITLILVIVFYFKYGNTLLGLQSDARQLVKESSLDTFRQTETSLVYDINGDLLSVLKGEKDVYYIDYQDIPEDAVNAMISIEDKKFKSHNGVDLKAMIRAGVALVRNNGQIRQGASTITQQVSRNIFLTHEVSWERKLKEMFIAMEMEKKYPKNKIMEFYLNNIYFANGYYGIQAASNGYFSKDVSELNLSEIVFLCSIPNSPTRYDPMDNMENTLGRRDRILYQMVEDGYITNSQYKEAINTEITLDVKTINKKNYEETYIYYSATRSIMEERGFEFKYSFESEKEREAYEEEYTELYNECQQSLFKSGYRIYTSIDPKKQKTLQKTVNESLKDFKDKNKDGIYELQGAAVCVDNETGRVVAIVGGRGQKTTGLTLNRAYQSYRQPGSAIKPLIVYTPALEREYNPESIVDDKKFEGGPRNSGNSYAGKITLRKAVESSKNTVAWKLYEELTPKVGLSYILNMNFAKIDANDYFPATSLGGFTNGVSAVEMAAGYSAIENDGIYRAPSCIVKIMNTQGDIIVNEQVKSKPVYEQNAARMMTDILTGVLKTGTGRGLGLSNMPTAGKTGTTNDKKDGWFVGYSPYYTTSVWVGYDLPKTLNNLTGASYPGTIWHNFMEEIHKDLEYRDFDPYQKTQEEIKQEEEEKIEEEIPEEEEIEEDIPEEEVVEEDDTEDGVIEEEEDPVEEEDPDYGEEEENTEEEEEDPIVEENPDEPPVEEIPEDNETGTGTEPEEATEANQQQVDGLME